MGKMKKTGKCIAVLLALGMVLGALTGCGMKTKDAAEYVQAALDAEYKGEFDDYIRITDSTEDDAKELYESNMDMVMSTLGLDGDDVSEELASDYRELLKEIFAKEKYTVGEATKTEEGFEVPVTAQKMQVFDGLEDELVDAMKEKVDDYGDEPSEEEINTLAFETLYDLVAEKIADPVYGEEETLTVHVSQNKEGIWSISEEDLQAVDNALIQ